MKKISRRHLIGMGLTGSALLATRVSKAQMFCDLTPADGQGPFHPTGNQLATALDQDSDLTFVQGKTGVAKGQLIYVFGQIQDTKCQPVPMSKVRIWQANMFGKYVHPGDTSSLQHDPNFQGWGEAITDDKGMYIFKSILPGEYGPGNSQNRRRHIHFKVFSPTGVIALTTQMYFSKNHPLTLADLSAERPHKRLIRDFLQPNSSMDPTSLAINFPITIRL